MKNKGNILRWLLFLCLANEVRNPKVYPEYIIMDPLTCVNITLNDVDISHKISISLMDNSGERLVRFHPVEEDLVKANYYYFKYMYDIGFSWIILCEIDQFIENKFIMFTIVVNSKEFFYKSSRIIIASTKYSKECSSYYFKTDNYELRKISFLPPYAFNFYAGFEIAQYPTNLIAALCSIYANCKIYTFSNNTINIIHDKNSIIYSTIYNTMWINFINSNISQYTLHFIDLGEKVKKVYTIQFLLNIDFIKTSFYENKLTLNIFNYGIPKYYKLYFKYENEKYLTHFSVVLKEFRKSISSEKFKFLNETQIEFKNEIKKYGILFIDICIETNNEAFFVSKYVILEFDQLNIGLHESSLLSSNSTELNRSLSNKSIIKTYGVYIILGCCVIVISVLVYTILIYYMKKYSIHI